VLDTAIGKADHETGLAFRGRRVLGAHRRLTGLSSRIVVFNAVALAILIAGMLLVQSSRQGLVDERLAGVRQVASIVAGTLAEYATQERTRSISDDEAEPLLRQLISPTNLRARLYDPDGTLEIDTRDLLARNVVETLDLPPLDFRHRVETWFLGLFDAIMGVRPFSAMEPYVETGGNGRVYAEVRRALEGEPASARRFDQQNKLILSVAVPVERFRTIYGVLLVTTEGGDIDHILMEERATLIGISLVALAVMIVLSLYLSGTIARPMKALADAADRVRRGRLGRESIPPLSGRNDEIGDLANSLSAMTRALYDRIDAIERFAADVAHELKNPLTSLKSAVEMFQRANNEDSRRRLVTIIMNDIGRIDRLITDISDASRLDAELSREHVGRVDLAHLLEVLVEIYQLVPLARDVKLMREPILPGRAIVIGQDERLGQVFRNLIDNAVSFSPDGGTVTIEGSEQEGHLLITVEDEGPGIPPENLETIFNRFYTERPPEHGFGRNSGLGLSIARQIAEGFGGRIWAENRAGRTGARFVVEFPLAEKP
jgi:two-component system, OmpR family, sensor histidine kinase ChvG